ncbi:MAG: cytidylate kinase-like family protein [Candidatus Omnitrophica bacterium]|nr:cytidylate kinase-like family protein [Candidatus Omnitrophota bacterium]
MESSSKIYNYIASQCRLYRQEQFNQGFVTISRQAGAGGITIGEKLAVYLNKELPGLCQWTVFDKNLVDAVVGEHHLSKKILPFLKEKKVSEIEDMLENLLGLHPPQATLVKQTNETILRLARLGRVIIVGRGAPVITKEIQGGVHIRLIGSLKKRKEHIKEYFKFTDKEAAFFIENEDRGREQYLRTYFKKDINDTLIYDLIINTDMVSYSAAAALIGNLVIEKIKSQKSIIQKADK